MCLLYQLSNLGEIGQKYIISVNQLLLFLHKKFLPSQKAIRWTYNLSPAPDYLSMASQISKSARSCSRESFFSSYRLVSLSKTSSSADFCWTALFIPYSVPGLVLLRRTPDMTITKNTELSCVVNHIESLHIHCLDNNISQTACSIELCRIIKVGINARNMRIMGVSILDQHR